jgi:predicted site-specific integrase-resolvase
MKGYMTAQEASKKWSISQRQVQVLCKNGRIPGVSRIGRNWIIPENAMKPTYTYTYPYMPPQTITTTEKGDK